MAVTSAEILRHVTAFVSKTLTQLDLRHRLFAVLRAKTLLSALKSINLAAETLENALSTSKPSVKSSSLRLAENLLVSLPENLFSSLILSLIYSLVNRLIESAIAVLTVFVADQSLARSEIAPQAFEEMFLMHFLPVLQWYSDRRAMVTQLKPNDVVSGTRVLSKMSENRASELKELEREYERVLDDNCRVFAAYFKLVLENRDGDRVIDPPVVVLEGIGWRGDRGEFDEEDDGSRLRMLG